MIPVTRYRLFSAFFMLCIVAGSAAGIENTGSVTAYDDAKQGIMAASGEGKQGVVTGQEVRVLPGYSSDRLIVRYKTDRKISGAALPPVMDAMNRRMGATVVRDFSEMGIPGMQIIRMSNISVEEAVQSLSNNTSILYAEPDHLICLSPDEQPPGNTSVLTGGGEEGVTPDDPDYPLLWGLHNTGQEPVSGTPGADIDAPGAWTVTTGSSSVVLALIDTGVDYTHPDLAANIWTNPGEIADNNKDDDGNGFIDDTRGWDFVSDDADPADDNGHGTHCAGTIAAVGNNNLGITGVSWKGSIMPLKFLDSSGNGYTSDAISAILYANQMGADVISCSWGGTGYSHALEEAINESSAVVVCAAGNNGDDSDSSPVYPAAYPSSRIISVAATDYNDELASFSNYGASSVDIGAPGVSIRSTWPGNQYTYLSGTSMAAPHVSGVAALLIAVDPSFSASAVREKILASADAIPSLQGKLVTGGRLNAATALGNSQETQADSADLSSAGSGESGIEASFMAAPTKGTAPLTVQFLDTSPGGPVSWMWNFGDGDTSSAKSPRHTYRKPGKFTVTLKTTGIGGEDTAIKTGYITVT